MAPAISGGFRGRKLTRLKSWFGQPAAAGRDAKDRINQRVGPAGVRREVLPQRGMVQRMRLRRHQQADTPHCADDPRIVGAVQRAVEILGKRAADDENDCSGDQPSWNGEGPRTAG